MRMQDRANWESQEKSNGDIRDQHEQPAQDERKAAQKRTFTRWMNAYLQRCNPPVEMHDLFTDIQDGRILMALLEELSGCKLLYRFRSSSHRIFRLNNISKALEFLDDRHVKLLGIDASGIADGVPSVILNLVWNIILHFQVKEVTRCLQRHMSYSLSSLSMSSYPSSSDLLPQSIGNYSCNTMPSKGRKSARRKPKYQGKAIKTLLLWVQRCTSKFGVEVYDFGKSWRSGLPFLALIKHVNPDLVDLRESLSKEPRENIQQAFTIAHHSLDIIPLLEPEDVACSSPDEQSIITYVSMFLRHCSGIYEDHTTDIEVPEIPNFGSPESVSLGEIHADNAEAQALFRGLEKSSEQLLWTQWSRRSSGSLCATSLYTNGTLTSGISSSNSDTFSSCHSKSITEQSASGAAVPQLNKKKGRCRSVLQPPSPLDAGVVSQEIQSWMEKGSDQTYSKARVDESHYSLSSEEGIYSLSALDSDEEDAYSYILDLNKEVSQPYNQLRRQVPSVKEETTEEMNEESRHCETCDILNGSGGCKPHEGSVVQNADFDLESEVKSHSVVQGEFDLDKNESSFSDMTHNRPVFDMEPEDESTRKEREDRVRGEINDYGEEERETGETENVRLVTHGYDKTEAQLDEAGKAKIFEMDSWQKEVEGDTDKELLVRCVQMSEKRAIDKEEEEHLTVFEEGQERKLGKENDEEGDTEEGLGEGINKNILTDKIRGCGGARSPTEEENDTKHSTATVEDLTNNCKDEDMEENTGEVTNTMDFVAVQETDRGMKIKKSTLTAKKPTTIDHLVETTPKNDTDGGVSICANDGSWTSACTGTSHIFSSKGGFSLQSVAASCDITPLELEVLLVLWILLYCCLILPQMNL